MSINLTEVAATTLDLTEFAVMPLESEGTTPPVAPAHGDRWILEPTTGVKWELRYNTYSVSPYKWEFVGGSVWQAAVETAEVIVSDGAYHDASTVGPQITIPRAGDYEFIWSASLYSNAVAQSYGRVAVMVGGTLAYYAQPIVGWAQSVASTVGDERGITVAAAATVCKLQYLFPAGVTGYAQSRCLRVRPVRIT